MNYADMVFWWVGASVTTCAALVGIAIMLFLTIEFLVGGTRDFWWIVTWGCWKMKYGRTAKDALRRAIEVDEKDDLS